MAQDRDKWWALVNMGPIKSGKYLKKLGDYQLLKNECAPWNCYNRAVRSYLKQQPNELKKSKSIKKILVLILRGVNMNTKKDAHWYS